MNGEVFVTFSLSPLLMGSLAALACALPGNFLVLRRQALVGDAISHVVLPGIVLAFLVTGTISTWPMLLGSAAAAVVAVVLIEGIRRFGRIEPGAAMGVVFTAMFAAGVLALEQSDTSGVHLDVEHALFGNLESLIWLDATGWASLVDPVALAGLPPELFRICLVTVVIGTDDEPAWRPGGLVRRLRAHRGDARVHASWQRAGMAWIAECGERRRHGGDRGWHYPCMCRRVRTGTELTVSAMVAGASRAVNRP